MKIYKGRIFSDGSIQVKIDNNGKEDRFITKMVKLSNLIDVIPENNWM